LHRLRQPILRLTEGPLLLFVPDDAQSVPAMRNTPSTLPWYLIKWYDADGIMVGSRFEHDRAIVGKIISSRFNRYGGQKRGFISVQHEGKIAWYKAGKRLNFKRVEL
jgi:hypothetical protein